MKRIVEKKGSKIVVRARPDDCSTQLRGVAARLMENEHATLTERQRDLLLVAIAQHLGIDI
jgi:hypothetical protein